MAEATLERRLGRVEVLAQSVANMAPTGAGGIIIPVVFSLSGGSTWVVFVIASAAMLLLSRSIAVFASRSATVGALYNFVGQGLGPGFAVIAGWAMLIAYLMSAASSVIGAVIYAESFLPSSGLIEPALTLFFALIAWGLAYRDIRISTKSMLALEGISMGLIVICVVAYLIHVRADIQLSAADIDPGQIRLGLVLAIFSFTGFESAATLGREAKRPQSIPGIMARAVLLVGFFFCLIAVAVTAAFTADPAGMAHDDAPLATLARLAGFENLSQAIAVMIMLSSFACALASMIAGGRVLMAMAEHGLVTRAMVRVHTHHMTPHLAVSTIAIAATVPALALALFHVKLLEAVDYLATIGTFGFLSAYLLVVIAAPIFLHRRNMLTPGAVLLAVVTAPLILFAIIGSIYPVPGGVTALLPYIFVGLMLPGIASFLLLRSRRPALIQDMSADLSRSTGLSSSESSLP